MIRWIFITIAIASDSCLFVSKLNSTLPFAEPIGVQTTSGSILILYKNLLEFKQGQLTKKPSEIKIPMDFGYAWAAQLPFVYVFSGYSSSGVVLTDMYKINLQTSKQESITSPDQPSPRGYAEVVSLSILNKQFLLVVGGEDMATNMNDVWAYDTVLQNWHQPIVHGDFSHRKQHSAGVILSSDLAYLFIFGGNNNGKYLNDLCVFKIKLVDSYVQLEQIHVQVEGAPPSPREGHSMINYEEGFLISGGCDYSQSVCFADVFYLKVNLEEPLTVKWTPQILIDTEKCFTPRETHLSLMNDDGILIFGGKSLKSKTKLSSCLVIPNADCSLACNFSNGQLENGKCVCEPDWTGENCEIPKNCNCHSKGECINGHCVCQSGYYGSNCELSHCMNNCSGNGTCNSGFCECTQGFMGEDCSVVVSLLETPCDCNGRGVCFQGVCSCSPDYFGPFCEFIHCKTSCGSEEQRGFCDHHEGTCTCNSHFGGASCEFSCPYGCPDGCVCSQNFQCDCSTDKMPSYATNCNKNGLLIGNECQCMPGFCGKYCEDVCKDCSGRGLWKGNACKCDLGYWGSSCEFHCRNRCSSHGECVLGKCECHTGWEGEDCSLRCDCNGNGICSKGKCTCFQGYSGNNCETIDCPHNCTVLSSKFSVRVNGEATFFKSLEDIPLKYQGLGTYHILETAGFCKKRKGCECYPGYTGSVCQVAVSCPRNCTSNGTCQDDGTCHCNSRFAGPDCSLKKCPFDCSGNGVCNKDGTCTCYEGYFGEACSAYCPDNCSGNGECKNEVCVCFPGYEGVNCATKLVCESNCNDHGVCHQGTCYCSPGWYGSTCQHIAPCPSNCSGHGQCIDAVCRCRQGWFGADCSQPAQCWNGCSGKGLCVSGLCECLDDWTGPDCSLKACPDCKGKCVKGTCYFDQCGPCLHGSCIQGECLCEKGYTGPDCSIAVGPDCSGHGTFHHGRCVCEPSYTGLLCEKNVCSDQCSANGICHDGQCYCLPGFTGADCSLPVKCPGDCPQGLICQYGLCISYATCPQCRNGGVCDRDSRKCLCKPGFYGEDCALRSVKCEGNRVLSQGKCECKEGWAGAQCDVPVPLNCKGGGICSGKGKCLFGKCHCDLDYEGEDCTSKKKCPSNCSERGICKYGKCFCYPGFEGSACESTRYNNRGCKDCSGICVAGECYCVTGDVNCTALIQYNLEPEHCPMGCSGRGRCVDNKCVCDKGWTGEACEAHISMENSSLCDYKGKECNGHGICSSGRCFCEGDFAGTYCQVSLVCSDCNGVNMECVRGKCVCKRGWGGEDCSVDLHCADVNCGEAGVCLEGRCYCEKGYSSYARHGPCVPVLWSSTLVAIVAGLGYAAIIIILLVFCRK